MPIELLRMLHHRSMATLIEKDQFGVLDQLMELLSDESRGDLVLAPPNQKGRRFDLMKLIAQVVSNGGLGSGNHPNGLVAVVDDVKDLIDQFLRGHLGVVEGRLCLLFFFFLVSTLGKAGAHGTFKQPGAPC